MTGTEPGLVLGRCDEVRWGRVEGLMGVRRKKRRRGKVVSKEEDGCLRIMHICKDVSLRILHFSL